MSLRLHRKYGVNPTMPVCFFCGSDKGEVALLGAAYKGEAPSRMIIDKKPCETCAKVMRAGVLFLEIRTGSDSEDIKSRTGKMWGIKESALDCLGINKEVLESIKKTRVAILEEEVAQMIGFHDVAAKEFEDEEISGDGVVQEVPADTEDGG